MKKQQQKEAATIIALWAGLIWILYRIGKNISVESIGEGQGH